MINNNSKILQIIYNYKKLHNHNFYFILGQYISKSLRIGRAVSIPKFGLFTFSASDFSMEVKFMIN